MKKQFLFAALLALTVVACGKKEEAPAVEAAPAAAASEAAPAASAASEAMASEAMASASASK